MENDPLKLLLEFVPQLDGLLRENVMHNKISSMRQVLESAKLAGDLKLLGLQSELLNLAVTLYEEVRGLQDAIETNDMLALQQLSQLSLGTPEEKS